MQGNYNPPVKNTKIYAKLQLGPVQKSYHAPEGGEGEVSHWREKGTFYLIYNRDINLKWHENWEGWFTKVQFFQFKKKNCRKKLGRQRGGMPIRVSIKNFGTLLRFFGHISNLKKNYNS